MSIRTTFFLLAFAATAAAAAAADAPGVGVDDWTSNEIAAFLNVKGCFASLDFCLANESSPAQEIKTNVDTKNHLHVVFLNYYLTPLFLYRISFLILSTASQKAHSNESLDHVQDAFPCGVSRSFSDSKMGTSIP